MNNNVEDYRITKLRDYLISVIEEIGKNRGINVDALPKEIDTYSLDKIPIDSTIEKWIIPIEKRRDVFSFRSRKNYSYNDINNLKNIGFFEKFEDVIRTNNENGILPEIENIESIECLNCGALNNADTKTAEFDIQLQITYLKGAIK